MGELTIVGAYLPSDNGKQSTYELELDQIEVFLENNANCVVMGDFNADINRGHVYTIEEIPDYDERRKLNRERSECNNDKWFAKWLANKNYLLASKLYTQLVPNTFASTAGKISCIDHVIIKGENRQLLGINVDLAQEELDDLNGRDGRNDGGIHRNCWADLNVGDHRPLMVEV